MIAYIFLLTTALFFSRYVPTKEECRYSTTWVWLVLILTLFQGLRNSTVGTDTPSYCREFLNAIGGWRTMTLNFDWATFTEEPGFAIINQVAAFISTTNYVSLLLVVAFTSAICAIISIRENSVCVAASLYAFISLAFYLFGFAAMRQSVALCVFMLSLKYLYRKKFFKYCVVILVAALFHKSVIITLPFYFITKLNFGIKSVAMMGVSGMIVGYIMPKLVAFGATLEERYELYQEGKATGGETLMLFAICLAIFFMFVRRYISINRIHVYDINLYFVIVSALIYLVVNMTGSYVELNRFAMYFQMPSIFLYADYYRVVYKEKKSDKFIFGGLTIVFLAYYLVYVSTIGGIGKYMLNQTLF